MPQGERDWVRDGSIFATSRKAGSLNLVLHSCSCFWASGRGADVPPQGSPARADGCRGTREQVSSEPVIRETHQSLTAASYLFI